MRIVPSSHPFVDAMLDAARRAAGVLDPRLVRVLDVGREDEYAYVVTEHVEGQSLAERLRDGPLPAEQVRTVVGEASLALESARSRGLHHLALTPEDLYLLDDEVRIGGLAVRAALGGKDGGGPSEANASDTKALVAIAYAGLTGCWPLDTRTSLPSVPLVAGAPVAPSAIVSGVPADLDTLCAQTFAGAGAPDTPGDLAAQIAPWGPARGPVRATGAFPIPLAPARLQSRPVARPVTASGTVSATVSATGPHPPPSATAPLPPQPRAGPVRRPAARAAAKVVAATATLAKAGAARLDATRQSGLDGGFGQGLFDDGREPPAPLLPPAPINRPSQSQTRTVLVLVSGFVAVFLLLGYCGLRGLGDNAFVAQPTRTPTASPKPTASVTPTVTPTPTSAPTTAPTAIAVTMVTGFDPQGDGSEKNSIAKRVIDGDPSTAWTSDTYRTRSFGGLKDGVGLLLDLGTAKQVRAVSVDLVGTGSTVQLRTATGDTLEGSTVVAQAADAAGRVTLAPASPVTTRFMVLWFSTPASKDGGGYRAGVSEVTVS